MESSPWQKLETEIGHNVLFLAIIKELVEHYRDSHPKYIPTYELEFVIDKLGVAKEKVWKPVVDFLCFESNILDLHFQIIDEDESIDISYEKLQFILKGEPLIEKGIHYTSAAALELITPYFTPNSRFLELINQRPMYNAGPK